MITNDDVLLSKLSYTDADFAELYPDLLDLAKNLTNKWDPSLSNESDPGVVLLKHAAFIGDHNNYNTDKNTLEAFLPTATQDISVRNIVEMNGYTPRYYISASGRISFNYKGDIETNFIIPAFTMVISNEDGTVAYTQIEDLSIQGKNITSTALFMEGTMQQLSINNNDKITMENIDLNYRVYFPNPYIAQNGVFVKNVGDSVYNTWVRDNYLLTQPKGEKRYKVDFDSAKNLPYIEFPSDIANLIGDGLVINYISTSGLGGNIGARTLNTIQSPDKYKITQLNVDVDMSDFELRNNSSITNGKDPETINEMYNSFKKVVGTFDTLVTCLDYQNALYVADDNLNNNYLGNVAVTDIRNDYNKAGNLVTYDEYGVWYKNVSLGKAVLSAYNFKYISTTTYNDPTYVPSPGDVRVAPGSRLKYFPYDADLDNGDNGWEFLNNLTELDFTSYINGLSPYDLVIHALKAYSSSDYTSFNPYYALNDSFTKPSDSVIKSAVEDINSLQCINHNFEYPSSTDNDKAYIFKEYAPIRCMITPYNKLSKLEKIELQDHIYRVLSDKYNSRMVDWGEPINEEILERDILNADERIRSVKLEPIEYVPTVAQLTVGESGDEGFVETSLYSNTDVVTDLIAKNFLAGRICLFEFDDTFEYQYGQQINSQVAGDSGLAPSVITDVSSITTETIISEIPQSETSGISKIKGIGFSSDTVSDITSGTIIIKSNKITELQQSAGVAISFDGSNFVNVGGYNKTLLIEYITTGSNDIVINAGSTTTINDSSAEFNFYYKDDQGGYSPVNISGTSTGGTAQEVSTTFDYTLGENEHFIIKNKNYSATKSYIFGITYIFKTNGTETTIPANTFYKLKAGETLKFAYTNSEDVFVEDLYQANTVIRSTFDIIDIDHYKLFKQKVKDQAGNTIECCSIPSSQRISICEPITTQINTNDVKCYWILNTEGNQLFAGEDTYRDLEQDEYFIYATKSESQMVIMGSGSRIKRGTTGDGYNWTCNASNISSITSNGFNASIDWQTYNFVQNPLEIEEYSITVLGKGSSFSLDKLPITTIYQTPVLVTTLSNQWSEYRGSITYATEDGTTKLSEGSDPYYIKTRLDISTNNENPQKLIKTSEENKSASLQKIIINDTYTLEANDEEPVYLQTNEQFDLLGGSNIAVANYVDNLSIYNYSVIDPTYEVSTYNGANWDLIEDSSQIKAGTNGYQLNITTYPWHESDSQQSGDVDYIIAKLPLQYSVNKDSQDETIKQYIIPIYLTSTPKEYENNISVGIEDISSIKSIKSEGSLYSRLYLWNNNTNTGTYKVSYVESGAHQGEVETITLLTKTGTTSTGSPHHIRKLSPNSVYRIWIKVSGTTINDSDLFIQFNTGDNPSEQDLVLNVEDLHIAQNSPGGGIDNLILGDVYRWDIEEFNKEETSTLTLNKNGIYLLVIVRKETPGTILNSGDTPSNNINILANLLLSLKWYNHDGNDAIDRSGAIYVMNPKVIMGINKNLAQYTTLGNVLNRITEILNHSSAPNTQIYYINKPENDLAIDNDDILNLFDKNNVANPITIAQIDFENHNSYIDIVKSMMKG